MLYTTLMYFALPFLMLRLAWRARRNPAYARGWLQRLGLTPRIEQPVIWIHAVSVGEVNAVTPIVDRLLAEYANYRVLITTITPTGRDQILRRFLDRVLHAYLPYDTPDSVVRFLMRVKPMLGLIVETELWPNLYAACFQREIPLLLLNARLSEASARGYRRFSTLTRETVAHLSLVAARSGADANRFQSLGASDCQLAVLGDLKFDVEVDVARAQAGAELHRSLFQSRPVWIAGSTHAGEEAQLLIAHQRVLLDHPSAILVLFPRHLERFEQVAQTITTSGLRFRRRSDRSSCSPEDTVFLGDSMGELPLFYASADLAFMGGSLVPVGGHNFLEAAAQGIPVIFGPHMSNFADAAKIALSETAATQVNSASDLADAILRLLGDESFRRESGDRARALVDSRRGATAATFKRISEYL